MLLCVRFLSVSALDFFFKPLEGREGLFAEPLASWMSRCSHRTLWLCPSRSTRRKGWLFSTCVFHTVPSKEYHARRISELEFVVRRGKLVTRKFSRVTADDKGLFKKSKIQPHSSSSCLKWRLSQSFVFLSCCLIFKTRSHSVAQVSFELSPIWTHTHDNPPASPSRMFWL